MANFIFILFHIIAIIFGFWMLVISIPAHILYLNGKKNAASISEDIKEQTAVLKTQQEVKEDTKKCLFCAEEIKVEAILCKHCGKEQ